MFQADRVFSQRNNTTGLIEWFFNAREGVFGPYPTKDVAKSTLAEFIERHKAAGDDGGRASGRKSQLSLASLGRQESIQEYDPLRRKKGKEDY